MILVQIKTYDIIKKIKLKNVFVYKNKFKGVDQQLN